MKKLLSGNEAIARGAYESGISVAAAYPGTPSTEILENITQYPGVYAQWSPNEKVAMEVGIGASLGGARALVTMKHVGVNVAADPLLTIANTGIYGGLVLVSADDPGMHSSQNEQDNRYYAKLAKIPLLEPSDSQEAKDMVGLALEISETFDTPVLLRTTTRVSHSQSMVEIKEPIAYAKKSYVKNIAKYVMMPMFARQRHVVVEERMNKLKEYSENTAMNRIEWGDKEIGIITSGISYQYVKEVLPNVSVLKLGFTNPLPQNLIKSFAEKVDRLFVVEELEPYIEDMVKNLGFQVSGKDILPICGEFSPELLQRAFAKVEGITLKNDYKVGESINTPARPPVLCPGCPHRGVFYTLNKLGLIVMGDIGCYSLGALPPLASMDTCISMGASIGTALGMEKADPTLKGKIVSVLGDSTFLHSGVTGLMDVVYNKGTSTTLILDNRITAMTGHQDNPGTGFTLMKEPTYQINFEQLVQGLGVQRVRVVDPLNLNELTSTIKEELLQEEPSVIIAQRPCALIEKTKKKSCSIIEDKCIGCKSCIKLGCPAISDCGEKVKINATVCTGCNLCVQVCQVNAIAKEGDLLA